jgi:hypothetical protein
MKRQKLYLSGKVSGDPYYAAKFKSAEHALAKRGHEVVNPCLVVPVNCRSWTEAMRLALREMLVCDGVALLPDWRKSKGAKIEERLAREIGVPVKPVVAWIAEEDTPCVK